VVGERDLERAVVLQLGRSRAADLVHLLEPRPGEEDRQPGVLELEAALHGPEGDLASAVAPDGHHGGFDQVEVGTIPQIGLDDPPPANQLAVHRDAHGEASLVASSFGSRTRL
jgi:hypothetical protein